MCNVSQTPHAKQSYKPPSPSPIATVKFQTHPGACLTQATFPDMTTVSILIDTGATYSLISSEFIQRSNYLSSLPKQPGPEPISLKIGNGDFIQVTHFIKVRFHIQDVPVYSKFYIVNCNNAYPLLLGVETMRDLSCKIDFSTNTLTIKNKYFVAKNLTAIAIPPNGKRKIYIQPTLPFQFNNVALLCKTKPEFRHIFGSYIRIVRITCDRLCAWLSEHGQHRVAI